MAKQNEQTNKRILLPNIFILLILISCQNNGSKEITFPVPSSPKFQPNILWLVAEDLGPYIPPFGDSTVQTPNLSRLAQEGVRYTHVFSPSGVCAPSRAAIATGMYPSHIGAHHMRTGPWYAGRPSDERIKQEEKNMPKGIAPYEAIPPAEVKMHSEYLRRAGYYCTNNAKQDYQFICPATAWDENNNQAHWRNRTPGQPFFSIFNFHVTHESQIWSKANDSLWVEEGLDIVVPPYLPDTEIGRKDVRRMYSNIKEMDYQIGKVLQELEADGLLDSTIIFWYTDHGGPLPRQKRLLYDSGLHLPMIIRFPGKNQAGTVDSQLISFIDFKPTILSLAGIAPPAYLDGQAFLGKYIAKQKRKYIHAAADRFDAQYNFVRAIRDQRFKYLRNFNTNQSYYIPVKYREQMAIMQELLKMKAEGTLNEFQAQWFRPKREAEELFDLKNDPHELQNLAQDPAYAEKIKNLRIECDRWMKEIDDKGLIPEATFRASLWPDSKQPVTTAPKAEKSADSIILSCLTKGASIAYQILDKPEETEGKTWQVYVAPVVIKEGQSLITKAHRLGYLPSELVLVN